MSDEDGNAKDLTEYIERMARAEERATLLEEQLRAAEAKPKAEPAKPLSDAQLQNLLDNGEISQQQFDDYRRTQDMSKTKAEVLAEIKAEQRQQKIDAEIAAYGKARPALLQRGSDDWKAANDEYIRLTKDLGLPETTATQVVACRNVFGPSEILGASHEGKRATNPETGGGGPGRSQAKRKGEAKIPDAIKNSAKFLPFYEQAIEQGRYSGWDDPAIQRQAKLIEKKLETVH